MQPGKLPAAMLAELLAKIPHTDERVLVGPGIGRDAAIVDLGDRVLVAKTDPVTFATDRIGWYAVHVNANDIACTGATPAWFLATALLPAGSPNTLPAEIFDQILGACSVLGIELIGGHAEVTSAVERPIIVGAMLGEAARADMVTGESVSPGDLVLLTNGIAIEGTALIARESPDALRHAGVADTVIEAAAALLFEPGISIVGHAAALRSACAPRLMHDPTEGGIATALYELASAAGATLRVDAANIDVFAETRTVCDALGLEPLGLLASGALLAIVAPGDADGAIGGLRYAGVHASVIGEVERGVPTVILGAKDRASPFPTFARDEIARFYDDAGGRAPAR